MEKKNKKRKQSKKRQVPGSQSDSDLDDDGQRQRQQRDPGNAEERELNRLIKEGQRRERDHKQQQMQAKNKQRGRRRQGTGTGEDIPAFNLGGSEGSEGPEEILHYSDDNEGSDQNGEGTDRDMGDGGGSDDDESQSILRKGKNNVQTTLWLQRRSKRIKGSASRMRLGGRDRRRGGTGSNMPAPRRGSLFGSGNGSGAGNQM